MNCSCPGVLVFLMGFWSSPKGFSGLCTVKWMTAWEQSGLCDSYLLRVSLLSLSLTWQKSLQILRNFLSVARGKPFLFFLFSSQSFYQVCFFPTKHSQCQCWKEGDGVSESMKGVFCSVPGQAARARSPGKRTDSQKLSCGMCAQEYMCIHTHTRI